MRKKILLTVVAALLAVVSLRSCSRGPEIVFSIDSETTVGTQPFTVRFSSAGEGLKNITVSYVGEYSTILLETKQYPEGVKDDTVDISLNPFAGIEDGPAEIRATAEVYGGGLGSGGETTKTRKIVADLSPPKITVISATENRILHAGSGVIIYKVSPDAVESGVRIGDRFFKGHKAAPGAGFSDKDVRISFFSYPHEVDEGETVLVTAVDPIGNQRKLPVSYSLERNPVEDTRIEITEKFIKMKMLPLISASEGMSLKEIFLVVNNRIRLVNGKKVERVLSRTAEKIMWEGAFLRPVGELQAGFQKRDYVFNGESLDTQFHLGYDLASQRRNPVRASNNGVVVFADDLGIYGNTIIIDHGMGVATLYAHLSSMSAHRGDTVAKNDIIGTTGATGLAFGDHLHFGMYIGGVPVSPKQWWDPFWVKTRITENIDDARRATGAGREN